ncbi:MAG: preprotein translocase subunit YajC [Candidatus Ancillula sp.]|nr:preprotein translocase subunit YajC [Candidatus Ancillula sp.]
MELSILLVVLVMVGMLAFSTRSNKKQQQDIERFRNSLSVGDEVMTGSGLIGKIIEKDVKTGTIVLDSEGTRSRWLQDAIVKRPEVNPEPIRGNKAPAIAEETPEVDAPKKTSAKKSSTSKAPKGDADMSEKDEKTTAKKQPKKSSAKTPAAKTPKKAKGKPENLDEEMTTEADVLSDKDRQEFEENDGLDSEEQV